MLIIWRIFAMKTKIALFFICLFAVLSAKDDRITQLEQRITELENRCCPPQHRCDIHKLKIFGYFQADGRFFTSWHPKNVPFDTFLMRRARIYFQGDIQHDWSYLVLAELANTTATGGSSFLQQAYLDYKKFSWLKLRAGQFKEPFSLAALVSSLHMPFIERPLGPDNFAPFEDIGVQAFGSLLCDRIQYAVGVFNGHGKNRLDIDSSDKEFAGRVVVKPLPCHDLYLAASGTTGRYVNRTLNNYNTAVDTTFVTFNPALIQNGNRTRAGFEAEYLYGPFYLAAEWMLSRREGVTLVTNRGAIEDHAWYVEGAYALTGEKQYYHKNIKPRYIFDPCNGCWGGLVASARFERFQTHTKEVFITSGTNGVWAWTGGLTWFPHQRIKLVVNYIHSHFAQPITFPGFKSYSHENAVIGRVQALF
jgi:phosphate-selective porin OprO/OprP